MPSIKPSQVPAKFKISHIDTTSDCLADRGGLLLLMRYLDGLGLIGELGRVFDNFQRNKKGISPTSVIRQTLGFLLDGTHSCLSHFDLLKEDDGYQAVMETPATERASSHQVKRFFNKFNKTSSSSFRRILRQMGINRMRQEKPGVIELFLDTMVLDNDEAEKREGVSPTYKKVKGFQPLQLIWDGQIIDAQFRGGKKNGNHGYTAFRMIDKTVKAIRKQIGPHIPVILRMDGGFL